MEDFDKQIWIMHCVDKYVDENCSGYELTLACEQCEKEFEESQRGH